MFGDSRGVSATRRCRSRDSDLFGRHGKESMDSWSTHSCRTTPNWVRPIADEQRRCQNAAHVRITVEYMPRFGGGQKNSRDHFRTIRTSHHSFNVEVGTCGRPATMTVGQGLPVVRRTPPKAVFNRLNGPAMSVMPRSGPASLQESPRPASLNNAASSVARRRASLKTVPRTAALRQIAATATTGRYGTRHKSATFPTGWRG